MCNVSAGSRVSAYSMNTGPSVHASHFVTGMLLQGVDRQAPPPLSAGRRPEAKHAGRQGMNVCGSFAKRLYAIRARHYRLDWP